LNLQELDQAFREARMFDPREPRGEYAVRMLTLMPSLHRLGHRKLFLADRASPGGTNLFFRSLKWGRFFLEEGLSADPAPLPVVVINYDVPGNLRATRTVRDHLREVESGRRYLGRLNVLLQGRLRFLAYFALTRNDAR
jgi:hypothetical protein